jgi:hypothetical protein
MYGLGVEHYYTGEFTFISACGDFFARVQLTSIRANAFPWSTRYINVDRSARPALMQRYKKKSSSDIPPAKDIAHVVFSISLYVPRSSPCVVRLQPVARWLSIYKCGSALPRFAVPPPLASTKMPNYVVASS